MTDNYYVDENKVAGRSWSATSDETKRYEMLVESFRTRSGCSEVTRGTVTDSSGRVIATIERNLHNFPCSFVLDHPNGHDYIICGSDYQGQTVIELDTGLRRDELSEGADKGFGFCWGSHSFKRGILIVDGCHWACPYEFRFYDFSDPMAGWPELKTDDEYVDADPRQPDVGDDGTVTVFQSENQDPDDTDSRGEVVARRTFKREGNELKLIDSWVSEGEQLRRKKRDEARAAYDAWVRDFRANDPLYLLMVRSIENPLFRPEEHMGIGIIHDRWCPSYPMTDPPERRICKRVHDTTRDETKGYTLDLEWGAEKGPIKLVIFRNGKHIADRFYDHSEIEMSRAIADALDLISQVPQESSK